MSYILYPQDGGKLAVVSPAPGLLIADVAAKVVPEGTAFKICTALEILPHFFDAYEFHAETGAAFNAAKGADIQRNRWRAVRQPMLDKLDVDYMRALEAGDAAKQTEIAAKKQALRDVTATPIAGTTPEEIAAEWPEILAAGLPINERDA